MPWTRSLIPPLKLNDGRRLATLSDARMLMLTLPTIHQMNGHWQHAADLMMTAARSDASDEDLADARRQLEIALKAERLIQKARR
jgi:hypothetical protein